ncbi:MAG TPA: sulfur oxidation c-type cytochrome SoxX, partial [Burkholderiales bacterium]|nr:sulfur oxidation c-type cytochrome SoxX [Burkholderiales bacterium]
MQWKAALRRLSWLALILAAALVQSCIFLRDYRVPLDTVKPASARPWVRYANDPQGTVWPQTDWNSYNTLTKLASPPVGLPPQIALPLQGDAEKGKKLAFDRGRGGGCIACHIMGKDTPALPGNVGPDLSTVGNARADDYLFNYIYEPRIFNPQTVMPPWGTHKLYTVDEIRDIVAFLKTLKEPIDFKDPLNNPERRPVPEETRDNLDPTENPGMFALDEGAALFKKAGPNGNACVTCHARPETEFKTWAATMPRWQPRLRKVINAE